MRTRNSVGFVLSVAWFVSAVSCTGSGSDIGPRIDPLPSASLVATVRDDSCQAVVAARVEIVGSEAAGAVTTDAGRVDMPLDSTGMQLVRVSPEDAAAADADDLLGYVVALDLTASNSVELPEVLHVADLSPSSGGALVSGAQPSPVVLDDTGTASGARVTVPAGSVVGAAATLRTGVLQPEHLPGLLPETTSPLVVGRGVHIGPAGVSFSIPADLEVPNDLGLPAAATARVYFLDPADGLWRDVGMATVDGSATMLSATGVVAQSGLYTTAVAGPSGAVTVSGRVVDTAGEPLPDVLVRAPQGRALTAVDGTFSFAVASSDGGGSARTLPVEYTGGRTLLAGSVADSYAVPFGVTEFAVPADVVLDVERVATFRGLVIFRGRIAPRLAFSLSGAFRGEARIGVSDDGGRIDFEDVIADTTTFQSVEIDTNPDILRSAEATLLVAPRRSVDVRAFQQIVPYLPGGPTFVIAIDALGGGLVADAAILRDRGPGPEFVTFSPAFGAVPIALGAQETVTVSASSLASELDGERDVISAFSVRGPRVGRLEMPIERSRRAPRGPFDAHRLVRGSIVGAPGTAPLRSLRVSTAILERMWFEQVAFGSSVLVPRVPNDEVPTTVADGETFAIGVPAPDGALAVSAEQDVGGGVRRLTALGFETFSAADGRSALARDVALALPTEMFTAPGAALGLDAAIAASELRLDLGLRRATSALVVDAARGLGGNHSVSGDALMLELGPSAGLAARGVEDQLVWISGSGTLGGGGMVTQGQLVEIATATGQPTFAPTGFLAAPVVTAPTNGATLSIGLGLDVAFSAPTGTDYIELELRSTDANAPLQVWNVRLPPESLSFRFSVLPDGIVSPVDFVAGDPPRDYELIVRALRIGRGAIPGSVLPYQRISTRSFGLPAAELGVTSVSSVRLAITLQP